MKKQFTEKNRVRFWASILALVWILLATKMGAEATVALTNHSEMYNWKNGMMPPRDGFIQMGLFLLMSIVPICIAIWPQKYIKHLKKNQNRVRGSF